MVAAAEAFGASYVAERTVGHFVPTVIAQGIPRSASGLVNASVITTDPLFISAGSLTPDYVVEHSLTIL